MLKKIKPVLEKLDALKKEQEVLNQAPALNLRDKLTQKDQEKVIADLENILSLQNNENIFEQLKTFLADRWHRVQGSFLSYTSKPDAAVTKLCLEISRILKVHFNDPVLAIYQYLMPSLTDLEDVILYEYDIQELGLNSLIESDTKSTLIPATLLAKMSPASQMGVDELFNPFDNSKLTSSEQKRLIEHSSQSEYLQHVFQEIHQLKTNSISLGGKIQTLINGLKKGGKHQAGHLDDNEPAEEPSSVAIMEFIEYWNQLDSKTQLLAGRCTTSNGKKNLQGILDVLTRKDIESIDCVEINSDILKTILENNKALLFSLGMNSSQFINYLKELENNFESNKKQIGKGNDKLGITYKLINSSGIISENEIKQGLLCCLNTLTNQISLKEGDIAAILQCFLEHKACGFEAVAQTDQDGNNILMLSALNDDLVSVDCILQSKFSTTDLLLTTDREGNNALMLAAFKNNAEIVKAILGSPNCTKEVFTQKNKANDTLLMFAADENHLPTLKTILNSQYCDSHFLLAQNNNKENALMYAIHNGDKETVRTLLDSRHFSSDMLMQRNKYGYTALSIAIMENQTDILSMILASPHCTKNILMQIDESGGSPLMCATFLGKLQMVEIILNNSKCDSEVFLQQDHAKNSSLLLATRMGFSKIVQELTMKFKKIEENEKVSKKMEDELARKIISPHLKNSLFLHTRPNSRDPDYAKFQVT